MKWKHRSLMRISSSVWLTIGALLFFVGFSLVLKIPHLPPTSHSSSLKALLSFGSPENICIALIAFGLLIGYFKGQYALAKSAKRMASRLQAAPNPASLGTLFSPGYRLLVLGMMSLGMSMQFFGVPPEIRGFIDIAVGTGLIQGGVISLRLANTL